MNRRKTLFSLLAFYEIFQISPISSDYFQVFNIEEIFYVLTAYYAFLYQKKVIYRDNAYKFYQRNEVT